MPTTMGLPDLEGLIRLLNAGEVTPMGGAAPASPLPADPVPGAGMPSLVQSGQPPLDMPGESFDAAPQGGGGFDWKRLLPLLPLAVAGLKGGMPAMGGFGEGFTRGASIREEQARLKRAQMAREAAERYAQMRDERQDEQVEAERQMRVLQMMPELADRAVSDAEAAGLDTPDLTSQFAERRYADLVAALGRQVPGLDPALLSGMGGDLRSRVSARLRSKAAPYYDKLTKDADPATLETLRADPAPRYLGMPFAELERIASADTPPARGKAEKVTPPNSLEAALARAVDAGDTAKADQIRREMARGRTSEPGTWIDTGRVNEQGQAIYVNNKTMQTRALPFGAKPTSKSVAQETEDLRKKAAIVEAVQGTLGVIDEILGPDGKLLPSTLGAIGGSRYNQSWRIKGTDAFAADAAINRLRARMVTDLMAKMKAQSRTGATGFGQLTEKELKLLLDAAAKLDPGLPEQVFEKEVQRIKSDLEKMLLDPTPSAPTNATAGGLVTITDGKGNFFQAPAGTPIPAGYTKVGG